MRGGSSNLALLPPKEIERYLDCQTTNDEEMNQNDEVEDEFMKIFETFHDAPFQMKAP